MRNTVFLSTNPENENDFMTINEVRGAVQAIREVVEKRRNQFQIESSTETSVVVVGTTLLEAFRFDPTKFDNGAFKGMFYVREYMCCLKTTTPSQDDEGIKEMLKALRRAVNNKLCVSG